MKIDQQFKQAGLICSQSLGIKPSLGTSPGVLEPLELAAGNDKIFRQPGIYEEDVKKKIIISLDYCNSEIGDEVKFLQFLKKHEFQIYICINNQVVELADASNEEGISSLLKNSVWMHQRDIIKALMVNDNKITSDRCLVLNYTGLQELTNKFIRPLSKAIIIDLDVVTKNLKSEAEVQLFLNRLDKRHQFYIKLGKQSNYSPELQKTIIQFLAEYKRILITKWSAWILRKVKLSTIQGLYIGSALELIKPKIKEFAALKELRVDNNPDLDVRILLEEPNIYKNTDDQVIIELVSKAIELEVLELNVSTQLWGREYNNFPILDNLRTLQLRRLRWISPEECYEKNILQKVKLDNIKELSVLSIDNDTFAKMTKLEKLQLKNDGKLAESNVQISIIKSISKGFLGENEDDEELLIDKDDVNNVPEISNDADSNSNKENISNKINSAPQSDSQTKPQNQSQSNSNKPEIIKANVSQKNKISLDNQINFEPFSFDLSEAPFLEFKKNQQAFPPNYFRIDVYDEIELDAHSFNLQPLNKRLIDKIDLNALHKYDDKNINHYKGQITLPADSVDWYPLPSMNSLDKLLKMDASAEKIDLGFRKATNTFYVRLKSKSKSKVTVSFAIYHDDKINPRLSSHADLNNNNAMRDEYSFKVTRAHNNHRFTVSVTKGDALKLKNATFDYLAAFLQSYFNFNDVKKPSIKPANDPIGVINQIFKEKRGACRHRVMGAMVLARHFGWKMRAVFNNKHAFVELYDSKSRCWKSICLGGWPEQQNQAKLENHKNNPELTDHSIKPIQFTFRNDFIGKVLCESASLEPGHKNTLCFIEKSQIEYVYKLFLDQFKSTKQKAHFIFDLDEVTENSYSFDSNGNMKKTDSGLIEFIKSARFGDVLFINWCGSKAKHVGFNRLIDADQRMIFGYQIPQNVIIISFHDDHRAVTEDFYSRHPKVVYCPPELSGQALNIPDASSLGELVNNTNDIQFFDEPWKKYIIGSCSIKNGKFKKIDSEFSQVVNSRNNGLVFRHAPWHLMDFRIAMLEMINERRLKIYRDDQPYKIDELRVNDDMTMDIGKLVRRPLYEPSGPMIYLLNSQTLTSFFESYAINSQGQLSINSGIIEARASEFQCIFVILTGNIPELAWARLIKQLKKFELNLKLIHPKNLVLPDCINNNDDSLINLIPENEFSTSSSSHIVVSNNPDFSFENLAKNERDHSILITVSKQTTYADLIEQFIPHDGMLIHVEGALVEAIKANKNVILKGDLSDELALQLQSLFFKCRYYIANGNVVSVSENFKLTLITHRNNIYPFTGLAPALEYRLDDYFNLLNSKYDISDGLMNKLKSAVNQFSDYQFTYSQLNEIVKLLQADPTRNPLKSFLRLHPDYLSGLKDKAEQVWGRKPKTVKDEMDKRINKITRELKSSPYVFIAGASGIGKSHLIQALPGRKVHVGMEKIEAWLKSQTDILFIDEANLEVPGMLDAFLGLMSSPPTILWKGHLWDLGQRKVIFAGNFSTFSGRMSHSLFQQYGHVVTFKEFSKDYLKSKILCPVWTEFKLPKAIFDKAVTSILDYYFKINAREVSKRPLTIRNLQMIVSRIAYYVSNDRLMISKSIKLALHEELRGLLNDDERKVLNKDLIEILKNSNDKAEKQVNGYITTVSRRNPLRLLMSALELRDYLMRLNKSSFATCGILIEGESGIGKTKLVAAYLNSNQISFVHMTPTDPSEMERVLLDAFHNGSIVVVDEINTLPLEKLLNALLSGVDPKGDKAKKPGFFVIGTMNPSYFANRIALSDALLNRFYKIALPSYSSEELLQITKSMTNDDGRAIQLVKEHEEKIKKAVDNNEHAPTPRDLFTEAGTFRSKIGNN